MARNFIAEINRTGLRVAVSREGISFPDPASFTAEQAALATDIALIAAGYPRNFGTLCRLLRENGQ